MKAIRVGIGGWTYEPWRGLFYPEGLRQADELAYAAARLTTIEINGTFYRTQTPETFRAWGAAVPDAFVFAVKAHRAAAQRTEPDEARPAIERFLESGLTELGPKLGPILWQLPAGRKFNPDTFARFLDLLPGEKDGIALRHVVEAVHPSFDAPESLALFKAHGVARAILDKPDVALREDLTAGHVYLRLEKSLDEEPAGYAPAELDHWARRFKHLAKAGHEVFAYVISGAKHRAPAGAMALLERL
jgi:uncharacterized protein YecE (DUF72 family)